MFSPLKKQREIHSSIIWDKFESVMKSIYRFSKLLAQLLRLSAAHKILAADAFSALQLHLLQLERTAAAGNDQLLAVGVFFFKIMSPVSSPSPMYMVVTPVVFSPSMMLH